MDIERLVNAADIAADVLRAQTERITSLERTVGEQAEQIGGLTSEMERARRQAEMNETHGRNLKHENGVLAKQLAASQAEAVTLRDVFKQMPTWLLEGSFITIPRDRWNRWLTEISNALATPSAAAERVQLLEQFRQIVEREIFSNLTPEDTWIQIGKRGLNAMRAALTALDAATGEEVKSDG